MRGDKIPSPSEASFNDTENFRMPTENLIGISTNAMGRPTTSGTAIREQFKEYFNGLGAVDWQENMIA